MISRSLAVTYVLLTAAVCSIVIYPVAFLENSFKTIATILLLLLAGGSVTLSVDLFFKKSWAGRLIWIFWTKTRK